MEGKGSFFVLIVIIAILTLTLAVAVGYLFIAGGNQPKTVTVVAEQAVKEPEDKELAKIELFKDGTVFNLKSSDSKAASVLMCSAELKYFIKIKGFKGKPDEKINFNLTEIQQLVNIYFRSLTLEEATAVDAEEKASKALTKQINEFLSKNEKEKYQFVYNISFGKWNYQ